MNGYFQLTHEKAGTSLRVFDATEGGEEISTREITDYLDKHKIGYDIVAIDKAVKNSHGEPVSFSSSKIDPIRETYILNIADDLMSVTVRFYPPSEGGALVDEKELTGDLVLQKIRFGVDKEAIDNFFQNRVYCTDIVIARGKMPRNGKDAEITYHFGVNRRAHPHLNADGSVDYHNLDIISHCKKGDVLATLTPADPGDYGTSVLGNQVKPCTVKIKSLHYGQNVVLSEDKLTLTADVDGHVSLQDGKVVVSNVLNIKNVDSSTGNIIYDGSVSISGDIASGFAVKAGGNIEVKGTIGGAVLDAGADVVMERGINGTGGGMVTAGGNVVTRFIENANVTANGSVTAEAILHSRVEAGTEVNVSGNKGFIVGGRIVAGERITAKTLGAEMGTGTKIEVGVAPQLKGKIRDTMKEVQDANKNLQNIKPTLDTIIKKLQSGVVLPQEQAAYAKKLMAMNSQLQAEIKSKSEYLTELQNQLSEAHDAYVAVDGVCNVGTTIMIGDLTMVIDRPVKYSKFVQRDGDIKTAPLSD